MSFRAIVSRKTGHLVNAFPAKGFIIEHALRRNSTVAVGSSRNIWRSILKWRFVAPKIRARHTSSCLQNCLKGLGLVSSVGITALVIVRHKLVVECKVKTQKSTRLDGLKDETDKPEPDFDWRQFGQLLWQDIFSLALAIVCALATALVNIKLPLMMGEVVNVISRYGTGGAGNFMEEIRKPALQMIGTYLIQGGLTVLYISLLSKVGENLGTRLRIKLFDSLLRQDIEFFDRHKTGELVDRLTSDVQDFKSSFKLIISQGLRALTQTIGCIGALYMISPRLTAVMCIVIPVIIGAGSVMGSGLRKLSRAAQAQVARSTAVADEALGNVRTVRAFAMEPKEHELFSQEVMEAQHLNVRLGLGIGMFQGLANIALNGIMLGSLFVGGLCMSRQEITAGDLMSFLLATQTVEKSLAQMSVLFGQVVRSLSAGSRVFEFINHGATIPLSGGQIIPFHSLVGDVEFHDVSFSYPTRPGQVVLRNFNLKVPGGKMVALVGASGGGKSTVAALLERFYNVHDGKVTVDGVNINDLDPSWLRGQTIGFINQEPVLFATTVMENIRYGCPDATNEQVYEAAKQANAHNFITGFPAGYDTVLGERGVTVSGGQKQRIAIARALIKNPSILVLDEATSALDAESERIVQEALDKVCKGRTTLVIAHRLSTIRDADIIAVVAGGKVVELGDHAGLKRKRGLYWELIKQQELEDEIQHFTQ